VAARGETFSLDAAMSHLTADIICRTIFSKSLEIGTARDVFTSFAEFERSVASVDLYQLISASPGGEGAPAWPCAGRLRAHPRPYRCAAGPGAGGGSSRAATSWPIWSPRAMRATGEGFTRKELIDQIGVFFLAGHETTASVMTWAFFILSQRPEVSNACAPRSTPWSAAARSNWPRQEAGIHPRCLSRGAAALSADHLHPARGRRRHEIGRYRAKKGTMIMIAPWTTHRHHALWPHPDRFDPDRFMRDEIIPGSYMPFGLGPRICVGAAFATIESGLMLARLVRRYDFEAIAPDAVKPVARLTTRPASEIMMRVRRRG
jgi:cytochrome P450